MTIRNMGNYVDSLWDWGFLNQCFPGTNIKVGDLDGCVERKGHFLMIEAKAPWMPVTRGQAIMFDKFLELAPGRTHVLVLWGKRNDPVKMQWWGKQPEPVSCTEADVQRQVSRWFSYANGR